MCAEILTRDGRTVGALDGSREGTGLGGLGKGVGCWKDARPDAKIAGEMPAGGALPEREVCARRILSRMSSLIRNSPLFSMLTWSAS